MRCGPFRGLSNLGMLLVLLGTVGSGAAQTPETEPSLEELRRIVACRRDMIEEQRKRIDDLERKYERIEPAPPPAPPTPVTQTQSELLRSGYGVKLYGFLRADIEGDTDRMSLDPQLPFFVRSPVDASRREEGTGNLTIHPRLSRIGIDIDPPIRANGWRTAAKLETDFYNAFVDRPAPANPDLPEGPNNPAAPRDLVSNSRAALRVRQAYVRLDRNDWHLLLGQTWDVISPLFPSFNANVLMWNAGNPGDRRPQFRVGYEPNVGSGRWSFVEGVGAGGAVDGQDLDGDGFRDGEAAVTPTFQGRVGYSGPSHVPGRRWALGVYGHTARQQINRFRVGERTRFDSRLAGVDLTLPLAPRIRLLGEAWTGRNLSDVRGGIGQGIDAATGREVRASGGWVEAGYQVHSRYWLNVGATVDRPDPSDLTGAGARIRNGAVYLTNRFDLGYGLSCGFDYGRWETKFKTLPPITG
jgi:hypothetical protein